MLNMKSSESKKRRPGRGAIDCWGKSRLRHDAKLTAGLISFVNIGWSRALSIAEQEIAPHPAKEGS